MNNITQTLQEMPIGGLVPVVALVIIGFLLWVAGRKILRGAFAISGVIVGGCAGWLFGDALGLGGWSWTLAIVGAISLACVSILAFRMAIAMAMATILGIAAPLGVIAVAEIQAARAGKTMAEAEFHNPVGDHASEWFEKHDDPEARQQLSEAAKSAGEKLSEGYGRAKDALATTFGDRANEQIAQLEQFSKRMVEAIRAKWDSTPESLRPTLIVSALAGGLLGLILGSVANVLSAAAITAVGGSLLWLGGLQILAARMGMADGPWMPSSGTAWLAIWLITSGLGVVIQWTFRKRKADKAA